MSAEHPTGDELAARGTDAAIAKAKTVVQHPGTEFRPHEAGAPCEYCAIVAPELLETKARPCPQCFNAGWVLDAKVNMDPTTLELIPCIYPECTVSGRDVATLCLYGEWTNPVLHPTTGAVMSLERVAQPRHFDYPIGACPTAHGAPTSESDAVDLTARETCPDCDAKLRP